MNRILELRLLALEKQVEELKRLVTDLTLAESAERARKDDRPKRQYNRKTPQ
jgi:hypothetical protein